METEIICNDYMTTCENWEIPQIRNWCNCWQTKIVEVAIFIETNWTKVIKYQKTMAKYLEQYFSARKCMSKLTCNILHQQMGMSYQQRAIPSTSSIVLYWCTIDDHKYCYSTLINDKPQKSKWYINYKT